MGGADILSCHGSENQPLMSPARVLTALPAVRRVDAFWPGELSAILCVGSDLGLDSTVGSTGPGNRPFLLPPHNSVCVRPTGNRAQDWAKAIEIVSPTLSLHIAARLESLIQEIGVHVRQHRTTSKSLVARNSRPASANIRSHATPPIKAYCAG